MHPADLVRAFIEHGLVACVAGTPLTLESDTAPPHAATTEALEALLFCRAAMESFIPPDDRETVTQQFDTAAKERAQRLLGSKPSGGSDRSAD